MQCVSHQEGGCDHHPRFGREDNVKLVRGGGVIAFRPDDTIGIINPLGKEMQDQWVLPKGHVEKGEDVRHTALREAMEELGVCGQLSEYEFISSHLQGDACYVTHFF